MDRHRLAEERSIRLHRAVADRLRQDPSLVAIARQRVERWAAEGNVHPHYVAAWRGLLARPIDELCAFLVDPGERARQLRQVSPFAGVLSARERWRIWRAAGHDLGVGT